jgi:hypothetical protein
MLLEHTLVMAGDTIDAAAVWQVISSGFVVLALLGFCYRDASLCAFSSDAGLADEDTPSTFVLPPPGQSEHHLLQG